MVRRPGFSDVEERLRDLSAKGDDLERIAALVDFTLCRLELEHAVSRADGTSGRTASHAAAHGGARLSEVIDANNTAGDVWADTACRPAQNEACLADRGLVSRIHRKKPAGRPMPARTRQANARTSAMRSAVEHAFARQTGPMGLVVPTIGIARARVRIGLAILAQHEVREGTTNIDSDLQRHVTRPPTMRALPEDPLARHRSRPGRLRTSHERYPPRRHRYRGPSSR